jgi:hypothetical protein
MALATINHAADGYIIAGWLNVSIVIWGKQATVPMVAELAKASDAFVPLHPKISSIQMILNGAPIPGAEARAALEALTEHQLDRLACIAMLIEGTGFWASAMRGFLTSMQLVQRHRFGVKTMTCATPSQVAKWLPAPHREKTGVALDESELAKVLAELLEHPAARPSSRS